MENGADVNAAFELKTERDRAMINPLRGAITNKAEIDILTLLVENGTDVMTLQRSISNVIGGNKSYCKEKALAMLNTTVAMNAIRSKDQILLPRVLEKSTPDMLNTQDVNGDILLIEGKIFLPKDILAY